MTFRVLIASLSQDFRRKIRELLDGQEIEMFDVEGVRPEDGDVLIVDTGTFDPEDGATIANSSGLMTIAVGKEMVDAGNLLYEHIPTFDAKSILKSISHLKRQIAVERFLEESEERYRKLVAAADGANVAVYIVQDVGGKEGMFVFVNKALERITGYSEMELLRMSFKDLFHPEEVERLTELYRQRHKGQKVEEVYTTRIRTKEGRTVHVELSSAVIPFKGQIATIDYMIDVSERMRLRREMERIKDHLYKLMAVSPAPIMVWSKDGMVTYFNRAAERATGYKRDDVVGMPVKMLFPDDVSPDVEERINGLLNGRWVEGEEIPFLNREGRKLTGLWCSAPVREDGKVVAITAIWQNVTERVEMEGQILQESIKIRDALEEAEETVRLRCEFITSLSHELRTPLNAIIGFSELLLEERFAPLTDQQREFVSAILKSGRSLLAMINDLLDLSRIHAGTIELNLVPVDIRIEVVGVLSALKRDYKSKRHKVKVQIPEDLPLIRADPVRINQIIRNLVENAIKFTPENGRIEIRARRVENRVQVSVSDTGRGIDKERIDHIFEEFVQLGDHLTGKPSGVGLGLPLVKRLVELHRGRVWIESEVGRGTTVTFEIPIDMTEKEHDMKQEEEPLILVIEDNITNRRLLQSILTSAGFSVVTASTGEDGIRKAQALSPSVITLDIMMPKMSGWDVLSRLKSDRRTREIPVIIISILDEQQRGLSLGAVDYLTKPVDKDVLLSRLRALCAHREGGMRILIVDDDEVYLSLIRSILNDGAHSLLICRSGEEALRMLQEREIDLILLDLVLPDISGFEVIRAIRSDPKTRRIPIMIVTAEELTEEDIARLNDDIVSITRKTWFSIKDLLEEIEMLRKTISLHRR